MSRARRVTYLEASRNSRTLIPYQKGDRFRAAVLIEVAFCYAAGRPPARLVA